MTGGCEAGMTDETGSGAEHSVFCILFTAYCLLYFCVLSTALCTLFTCTRHKQKNRMYAGFC